MAWPWLKILDIAMGLTDVARQVNRRPRTALRSGDESGTLATSDTTQGSLETRLAGVMVAALKEVFERDNQRLQVEREHMAAERARADRVLRLELVRRANDRETARQRVIAVTAAAGWLVTWVVTASVSGRGPDDAPSRILLGIGWALLLGALGTSLAAHAGVAETLAISPTAGDDRQGQPATSSSALNIAAFWLLLAGLAASSVAVLGR